MMDKKQEISIAIFGYVYLFYCKYLPKVAE